MRLTSNKEPNPTHHFDPLREAGVELAEELEACERVGVGVEGGRVEVGEHPRDLGEVGDGAAEEGGHAAATLQVVVGLIQSDICKSTPAFLTNLHLTYLQRGH